MELAALSKEIPRPVFKGDERLTFEGILNDPTVDEETKDRIRNDESCTALREILNSEDFKAVVRNSDYCDPSERSLPKDDWQKSFQKAKLVYEKIKKLPDYDNLIAIMKESDEFYFQ